MWGKGPSFGLGLVKIEQEGTCRTTGLPFPVVSDIYVVPSLGGVVNQLVLKS